MCLYGKSSSRPSSSWRAIEWMSEKPWTYTFEIEHTVHSRWGSLYQSEYMYIPISKPFNNQMATISCLQMKYEWNATNQFIERFWTSVYIVHIKMGGIAHIFMVAFCRSLKLTDKSKEKTIIVDFISLALWLAEYFVLPQFHKYVKLTSEFILVYISVLFSPPFKLILKSR